MRIEAVLMTGGKSSRMGTDKSRLLFDGEPLAARMVRLLSEVTEKVTVLGREPTPGSVFVEDKSTFAGPLVALAGFVPEARTVFLASCDLPHFDPKLVTFLVKRIESHPSIIAVVPSIDHHLQPLAALYRTEAFDMISTVHAEGRDSMMSWLETLWVERIEESELYAEGIDPTSLKSVDTPEAWAKTVK